MGLGIMKTTHKPATKLLLANILIILLLEPSQICANKPVITLYGRESTSLTIEGQNSADLRQLNFDNIAEGAQAQGLWIVYEDYNYHGAFELVKNTYKGFEHNLKGKVSSVRLVGASDDSRESSLTLYQGINFQGSEYYNFGDNSNLDGSDSSLIVTGTEPWTLYSSSNFGGNSVCITPSVVYDTNTLKIHSIRSVRRGC